MALKIFTTCLFQIFRNLTVVMKLSWAPILLFVLTVVVPFNISEGLLNFKEFPPIFAVSFIGVFLFFVLSLSVAVGWHRYILLDQDISWFSIARFDWKILPYLLHSIQIFLIFTLFFALLTFVMFPFIFGGTSKYISTDLGIANFNFGVTLLNIASNIFYIWFLLRVGMVLPAAAIGTTMKLVDSRTLTRPHRLQLLILALLLVLLNLVPVLTSTFLWGDGVGPFSLGWILFVLEVFFSVLTFFLGVGVLTVLYGHLQEGRPI